MNKLISLVFFFFAIFSAEAQLSGNYFIPRGAHAKGFESLAEAASAFNASGVLGEVRFYIDADLSETAANLQFNNPSATETNCLTIKPSPGKTPQVKMTGATNSSGATKNAGLTIKGTAYFTIDGSNAEGGTGTDLSFVLDDSSHGFYVINLYGNSDNVSIKNCRILFSSPMTLSESSAGIYANGQATGAADNLSVDNCVIGSQENPPYYALRIAGNSGASVYSTNLKVQNSLLYGAGRCIYDYYADNAIIESNRISCPSSSLRGSVIYGIFLNNVKNTFHITGNRITGLSSSDSSGHGLYGLSVSNASAGTVYNIVNNFFCDFLCLSDNPVYAIYFQTTGQANVWFNSFYINPSTSAPVSAVRCGSSIDLNLRNNILYNDCNSAVSSLIYWASAGTLLSDYNVFYAPWSSQSLGYFKGYRKTLADWQLYSGNDQSSRFKAVNFVSPADLHLAGSSIGDYDLCGTHIDEVTEDIDGNLRHQIYPYIGAADYSQTNPIPVELLSLEAMRQKGSVLLVWKTATEIDLLGFDVEKYANGNWLKLGFVKAAGNSSSIRSYSFREDNPEATGASYRLKMIDLSGAFKYSSQVSCLVKLPVKFNISQNYPNPFNPSTKILYSMPGTGSPVLEIFDLSGRLVRSVDLGTKEPGEHQFLLNMKEFSSGIYFYSINVRSSGGRAAYEVKKMCLLK